LVLELEEDNDGNLSVHTVKEEVKYA